MTPIQKRLEKLEQEMKYLKQTADKTQFVANEIAKMFTWLVLNLTKEQKADLANFVNMQD